MSQGTRISPVTNLIFPIAIVAIGVVIFRVMSDGEKPASATPTKQLPLVDWIAVADHVGGFEMEVDGVVTPYREIEISAEVSGRIVKKAAECQAGHYVTAQLDLLRIDDSNYNLEVARLTQQVQQTDDSLKELDVEVANTEKLLELAQEELGLQQGELNRYLKLKRAVSQSEVDRVRRSELAARNTLTTLRNQQSLLQTRRNRLESARELARVQLKNANLDLARTAIECPVEGVIVKEMVEQGNFVQRGAPLVLIEDTSRVDVKCRLKIDQLYWVLTQANDDTDQNGYRLPRTPVRIVYEHAGRDRKFVWNGELVRYDGIGVDEQTRMVTCIAEVTAPRDIRDENGQPAVGTPPLVRGMYVSVLVKIQPQANLLRIPRRALHPGKKVWRVVDGKIEIVGPLRIVSEIDIASESDNAPDDAPDTFWLVDASDSKLSAGDRLVTTPLASVHTGTQVRERQP